MAQSSYQQINLTADITLSWPFSFQAPPVIADINNINASAGNFKIILPDATLASPGQNILFNNISVNAFRIMNNDGTTQITSIAAGEVFYLYLSDTSTVNGTWTPVPFGGGISNINSVIATSSNNTITITNGSLTPPGGSINFSLTDSMTNLNSLGKTPGFLVSKGTNPLTWVTRELLGGGNIVVNDSDGFAADPVFVLANALTDITSAAIGNLQLSGDIITTNITNGGIQVSSAGTGKVSINGLQIDTSANITGGNNLTLTGSLTVGGSFVSPKTPKAFFTFTDTLVPASNKISILDSSNVSTITGSNGVYTITFTTAMSSTNYGVVFGLGSTGGSTPYVSHPFYISTSKTTSSFSIAIVDAGGVLVTSVPNGITGMIMLST